MLRGPLLAVALLALLGLGARQSSGAASHPRNGLIAYDHLGNGNRGQIYTMTATGAHRRHLTSGHTYSSYGPSWAPRGKRMTFVRAGTSPDVWTMDADGKHKRALTATSGGQETDPAWSPDGKWIAFAVLSPPPEQGIWLLRAGGKGGRVRVTSGFDDGPAWSPDGSKIAFERADRATQTVDIFLVPAGGGTPTELGNVPGASALEPAWSPDGSRILFASDRPDQTQLDLWVMNADGSDVRQVTTTPSRDERDPAWSPDGKWIAYSGEGSFHGASSSQIYVSRPNGSDRRILTHACGECAYVNANPSWQPKP